MNQLRPIRDIVTDIGLTDSEVEYFGETKAKLKLSTYQKLKDKQDGNLILVSAITPTPAGEGKTTTSIGLAMGLNRIGKRSIVTLREPSLGPLFGMKGGATGGGKTKVHPIDDINMHFTGDLHAVSAAHNLISAVVDNHLFRQKEPYLDPRQVVWNRVMDMNDRSLRDIVIGLGGKKNGFPRETNFSITASSEVMAILGLSESYSDLKERISNIFLGYTYDNEPVYLKQLNITGAVAALLKDALKPNLVQTSDGTPAFVHGGPFANIAQGTCSVLSMKMALKLSDYVITEAGFGFDLGAEKFFDIVARKSGLNPKAVVLVATIRALKMHGGKGMKELNESDPAAVKRGMPNLLKHIQNICHFGVPAVVAINEFDTDTIEEIETVQHVLNDRGIENAVIDSASRGSEGAVDLAQRVLAISKHGNRYRPLYEIESPIEEKVETVCQKIYGSQAVDFTKDARKAIDKINKLGLDKLPVCIAKTQKSLSDNPELLGRPKDFLVTVRDVLVSSGAGFLVPITGEMLLMPGLPNVPAAEHVDIDDDGNITGMF